jgi:hypothetical protein
MVLSDRVFGGSVRVAALGEGSRARRMLLCASAAPNAPAKVTLRACLELFQTAIAGSR